MLPERVSSQKPAAENTCMPDSPAAEIGALVPLWGLLKHPSPAAPAAAAVAGTCAPAAQTGLRRFCSHSAASAALHATM